MKASCKHLTINPFDKTAWNGITHDHDFEDPVLSQELGSSQSRRLD